MLKVDIDDFAEKQPDRDARFFEEVTLTDGGVYDNLGLERVWKRYMTVLVSDAGGRLNLDPTPPADWGRHAKRVLDIIHEQVSSVRKRQVIASFQENERSGAYWGIRTDIRNFGIDALEAPLDRTSKLAETPTRLKRLSNDHQERLINWGYAVCDAAIRKHYPGGSGSGKGTFPYPDSKV